MFGRWTAAGAVAVVVTAGSPAVESPARPRLHDQYRVAAQEVVERGQQRPASRAQRAARPLLLVPAPVVRRALGVARAAGAVRKTRPRPAGQVRPASEHRVHRAARAGRVVHRVRVRHRTAGRVATGAGQSAVVRYAYAQIGKPYVRGGAGRGGFDCSGLTMRAFQRAGKRLPHRAAGQSGRPVGRGQARPGDLVKWGSYHVGVYVGRGRVIHAPKPGDRVRKTRLWGSYRIVRVR